MLAGEKGCPHDRRLLSSKHHIDNQFGAWLSGVPPESAAAADSVLLAEVPSADSTAAAAMLGNGTDSAEFVGAGDAGAGTSALSNS